MAADPKKIALGCGRSPRSQSARARYASVIDVIVSLGRADLLVPLVKEAEIYRLLDALAAGIDVPKATDAQVAVLQMFERTPRALSMFARRNPFWLAAQISAALQKTNPQ